VVRAAVPVPYAFVSEDVAAGEFAWFFGFVVSHGGAVGYFADRTGF